jgi:hypothetical protein
MMLWILFGALCLVAIGFAAWPLYAREGRMTPLLAIVIVTLVALPAGLYLRQGSPDLPSAGNVPSTRPANSATRCSTVGRISGGTLRFRRRCHRLSANALSSRSAAATPL